MTHNSFISRSGAGFLRGVIALFGLALALALIPAASLAYAAPSAKYAGYSSHVPNVVIVEGKTTKTKVTERSGKTYPEGMTFSYVKRFKDFWAPINASTGEITIDTTKITHTFTNGKAEYTPRLDVIYPDHMKPTASFETIDAGKITVLQDSDKDGVPDKNENGAAKDICPNTPAGAKIDATNGCPVSPTLKAATVTGKVGTQITNTKMAITNEGKLALKACDFVDVDKSAGLSVGLGPDDDACVISGTPTKAGQSEVDVKLSYTDGKNAAMSVTAKATLDIADKDSDGDGYPDATDECPQSPQGATTDNKGCAVPPRMENAKVTGTADTAINPTSLPITNLGNLNLMECAGTLPEGLSLALNQDQNACIVSGTPKAASDETVPVTLKYTSDKGTEQTVTAQLTLNIAEKPVVTPKDNETYQDLAYADAAVMAGDSGKVASPQAKAGKLPQNTTFQLTADSKGKFPWISEDTDNPGGWKLNPDEAVPAGEYHPQVTVTFPDQSTLTLDMKITVTAKDPGTPDPGTPDPGQPDPGQPDPGKPNPGQPDPDNPNPGKPGTDNPMKPGSNPTQTDSDKDGIIDAKDKCPNTAAGVKVDAKGCPIAPADNAKSKTGGKQTAKPMPVTGGVAGSLAALSLLVTVAGVGLVARRYAK